MAHLIQLKAIYPVTNVILSFAVPLGAPDEIFLYLLSIILPDGRSIVRNCGTQFVANTKKLNWIVSVDKWIRELDLSVTKNSSGFLPNLEF